MFQTLAPYYGQICLQIQINQLETNCMKNLFVFQSNDQNIIEWNEQEIKKIRAEFLQMIVDRN